MEIEKLKAAIHAKLAQMVARNKSRVDYLEKFQRMIEEYNAGSYNTELFFKKLMDFAEELNEEEKRGVAEQLNEEEAGLEIKGAFKLRIPAIWGPGHRAGNRRTG